MRKTITAVILFGITICLTNFPINIEQRQSEELPYEPCRFIQLYESEESHIEIKKEKQEKIEVKSQEPKKKIKNEAKNKNEKPVNKFSEETLYYVAQCVEAEAGNQSTEGKIYVIDCILNRFSSKNYTSLEDVINAPHQFSCVSNGSIYRMTPEKKTIKLIKQEIENITNSEVLYFRTNHYHNFGTPLFKCGDHYFSK